MNHWTRAFVWTIVLTMTGCTEREDVVAIISQQRRAAESKSPPSPDELRQAAMIGDVDTVLKMIERGVDVNAIDQDGRSALHLASFDGFDEVVDLLLDRGADPRQVDGKGRTALMFASTGPHLAAVERLLEANSPVDAVDTDERFTALMFAAAEGQNEIVQRLLQAGADPAKRDADGESALDFATTNGHIDAAAMIASALESTP
jgi:uncharacterized protein